MRLSNCVNAVARHNWGRRVYPAVGVALEFQMRRSVVFLAVVAAVAAPTAAFAAKKKAVKRPAVVSTTPANQNQLSAKVAVDALHQIFVPLEVTLASLRKPAG
jgi:hypothetical protein